MNDYLITKEGPWVNIKNVASVSQSYDKAIITLASGSAFTCSFMSKDVAEVAVQNINREIHAREEKRLMKFIGKGVWNRLDLRSAWLFLSGKITDEAIDGLIQHHEANNV